MGETDKLIEERHPTFALSNIPSRSMQTLTRTDEETAPNTPKPRLSMNIDSLSAHFRPRTRSDTDGSVDIPFARTRPIRGLPDN